MNKQIKSIITLGLALSLTVPAFATPVETTRAVTQAIETTPFLYDMSNVGTVKDNVATIGGQIVTPEGKGLPNIPITVNLYKTLNKYDEKRFGVTYTDSKGFWKLDVDKNDVSYTELLVDGIHNETYYFAGIKPKDVEYEGFITASVQDLLDAKISKTVAQPRKFTRAIIKDRYGNGFVYANSNNVTQSLVTTISSDKVEFQGYEPVVRDKLPIKQTSKLHQNEVLLTPKTPVKTYTGQVSIGDKLEFKDYWILATPKDNINISMYIKVSEDGTFKIDNLEGDMVFKVVKVDKDFKQIEAYTPIEKRISSEIVIKLDCNPNQYMVRIEGDLKDCILNTDVSGSTAFVNVYGKVGNLGGFRFKEYTPGIVLPIDEDGSITLNYKSKRDAIPVKPTADKPIVEINISDLVTK